MPKRPRKIRGKKISDSQAPNKVGFDGNVSRTVRLRDIAGAGKRDLRVVMRPSRWQEQYLRGFISSRQLSAVERLERDWHSSKLISYSSVSAARGSSSGSRPVDSKIDAMLRKDNALDAIALAAGKQARKIVVLTIIENLSFAAAGRACKIERHKAAQIFHDGLEVLVNHYA
jgi:hypothetical protein